MGSLLDEIEYPNDIKKIAPEDYKKLATDIRTYLMTNVSHTGGHLASNLGAVELTMALHLCLDFPEDKLVWDVGHQAYTHKILTGRKELLPTLRSFHGLSGFPKTSETPCDAFDTGHSSTSISIALGLAKARDLQKEHHKVFAVIGDGALSGGMAYEALNNTACLKSNMVIVLNDNKMSISENVGGMSNYLGKIRTNTKYIKLKDDVEQALEKVPYVGQHITNKIRKSKDSIKRLFIPGMLFEDMGITYIGPVDGHNIDEMLTAFESATNVDEPVLVHVQTKKGKGYRLAEKNPSDFHGVEPFVVKTGQTRNQKNGESYTEIFGRWMMKQGELRDDVVGISAAMPNGTGLSEFAEEYPDHFVDVGIAEEHAVTFAAGLAAGGMHPVVALYSTFLQRAYDQILHDVCIGRYPVIFAIDRSGIVGRDGETHQGIYDISFLSTIPGLTIMAPKDGKELEDMLNFALDFDGPVAVKYPRGIASLIDTKDTQPIEYGQGEILRQGKKIAIFAIGNMVETALEVGSRLEEMGFTPTIINSRFVKPIDAELIKKMAKQHSIFVTLEENVATGGFGQQVEACCSEKVAKRIRFIKVSLPDIFVEHGRPDQLREKYSLDSESIVERIKESGWLG